MKPALRVILINLGLIAAAVVVVEIVFGSWVFGPSYGNLNLPRNTQRLFDVSTLYERAGPVTYTRDEHGLRGRYRGLASIDILAIGGSTTNELFISDEETWTARLAENFARAGRPVSVVNAGVDGQSTIGHLRNFEVWFPRLDDLKPRYVLAYIGINDLAIPAGGKGTRYDVMKSPEWNRRLRHYVMNHSALYEMFRKIRGSLQARAAKIVHARLDHANLKWVEIPAAAPDEDPTTEMSRRLAAYRERLRELVRRIRAMGAEPIFVTQHKAQHRNESGRVLATVDTLGNPQIGTYQDMARINRVTMAACREAAAICIDLGTEIEFRPGEFYDNVHTTPAGSKRIADFLFERLKDRIR